MEREIQKRKGKSRAIIDRTDYDILKILAKNKKLTITELRNKIGLTHANLTTHLKRGRNIIERKRDKQTIYVSLNKDGKHLLDVLKNWMED